MTRPALQNCPYGCGRKHYGPPTATNCTRYGSSADSVASTPPADSLASKSLLDIQSTEELEELPEDIDMDEYVGITSPGIVVDEQGNLFERSYKTSHPYSDGIVAVDEEDLREQEEALVKGEENGWQAVTGFSGQHGYDGPVMHASEVIGDSAMADYIRDNPGEYVAVTVSQEMSEEEQIEEYGELPEDGTEMHDVGWMLLHKSSESPGSGNSPHSNGSGVDMSKVPPAMQRRSQEAGNSLVADSDGEPILRTEKRPDDDTEIVSYEDMDGNIHRTGGPSFTHNRTSSDGRSMHIESYQRHGKLHRDDGPAMVEKTSDGFSREAWYQNDKPHRDDGEPAEFSVTPPRGKQKYRTQIERWHRNGQMARPKGKTGQPSERIHHGNGNAEYTWTSMYTKPDGTTVSRVSRDPRHGPARELFNVDGERIGYSYQRAGSLHRLDGPARGSGTGDGIRQQYFLHGTLLTNDEWSQWQNYAENAGQSDETAREFIKANRITNDKR